jgi:hypothetical protein
VKKIHEILAGFKQWHRIVTERELTTSEMRVLDVQIGGLKKCQVRITRFVMYWILMTIATRQVLRAKPVKTAEVRQNKKHESL